MRSDIKAGFWKTQNIFFRLDGQYCSLSMGNGSSSFPLPIYFTKYINAGLEFANGTYLPFGNYVMFKSKLGLTVYTYEYLQGLRKTSSIAEMFTFTEEQFFSEYY